VLCPCVSLPKIHVHVQYIHVHFLFLSSEVGEGDTRDFPPKPIQFYAVKGHTRALGGRALEATKYMYMHMYAVLQQVLYMYINCTLYM